jgi:hypothetical protein
MQITDRSFYSLSPDGYHTTGDIWIGLPSLGLLPQRTVSGLIVTPACDLANCKTETITYIPVVSINTFVLLPEFISDLSSQVNDWLKTVGSTHTIGPSPTFDCDYNAVITELEQYAKTKHKALSERSLHLIRHLNRGETDRSVGNQGLTLATNVLGTAWGKIKAKIVRNAYRSDIYFLPKDSHNAQWSAIPTHSVALLRYLITVPTYFLNEAYSADERDWPARRAKLLAKPLHWCAQCDENHPPLRALRLEEAFLSDLLTKLVGIYVRLGAPDMDPVILSRIESDI